MGCGEVVLMPRTSRFVIELSVDERDVLERRAREVTALWREVQRARMILYASEGLQDKEIAATLGIGTATVHTHIHRLFDKLGVHSRRDIVAKYLNFN